MIKNKRKLPTILALFILLFALLIGFYLTKNRQSINSSADSNPEPKNVRVSNITDKSLSISWTTDIPSKGFITWRTGQNITRAITLEDSQSANNVHHVTLDNLTPNSIINFKITSGDKDYDNNGIDWSTKTTSSNQSLNESPVLSIGSIINPDGFSPSKSIVYITIENNIYSSLTSDQGNFVIPILDSSLNSSDSNLIEISALNGLGDSAQAITNKANINKVSTIVLGKKYDFRNSTETDSSTQPQSIVEIPESVEKKSRFEAQKTESNNQELNFTLESINDGEIITTTDPEFFGSGPKNSNIQISVHSSILQEVATTTDKNGKWSWSPPSNLEEGEHTVTLSWRDANGILQTITKNFVVSASEGPAFESSQSATLATATPKATVLPTIKPVIQTPKATSVPTPVTGNLTPTIGLFIMGIGVLLSSIFIWNNQNA